MNRNPITPAPNPPQGYERRQFYSAVRDQRAAAEQGRAPRSRRQLLLGLGSRLAPVVGVLSRHRRLRLAAAGSAAVLAFTLALPLFSSHLQADSYNLAAAKSLVMPTSSQLQQRLSFNKASQSWVFNPNAAAELPTTGDNAAKVGGVLYSATLPADLSQGSGLTLTDPASKLNITLKPQFATGPGQMHDGYAVYPLNQGASQLIYTFKQNGLKEDIVLRAAPGKTANYSYTLGLPGSLQARLQQDGSVGIFGGDPSLFGNISYGSSKDQALVEKARQNSKKDHLLYAIPAPVVKGNGTTKVHAKFVLNGDKLTVQVSGLNNAHYPLSIDPSLVMNTTNCGFQTGNADDNISFSGCQISRNTLSGGTAGAWGTTSPLTQAGYLVSSVAYNGYLYLLSGAVASGAFTNTVQYAAINGNGTVGAWHYTHNSTDDGTTFVAGFSGAVGGFGVAVYNGYLYLAGGQTSSTVSKAVQYARLNSNGTVGSWQAAGAGANMNTTRVSFGFEAYNGYVYAYAGCTASPSGCTTTTNSLEYARVNADGTLTAWTLSANNLTTTRENISSAVYNGYLYALGGCVAINLGNCTSVLSSVEYAPINANGTVGTWQVANSFTTARTYSSAIAVNGYLYLLGGNLLNDVQMAKIYANGSLGPWQATTSFTTGRYGAAAATYNGYLYLAGGCNTNTYNCGSGLLNDVQYSQISTTLGTTSAYTAGTTVASTYITDAASIAYGGYVYLVGGSNSYSGGTANQLGTVQYAKINADGSLGTWTTSSTSMNQTQTGTGTTCATAGNCPGRVALAAGIYNGYLYIAGGRSGGASVAWSDVQSTPLNATTGAPGTWTTLIQDFTTNSSAYNNNNGISNMSMQIYNGYMYLSGGVMGSPTVTAQNTIYYAPVTGTGGVGTFNKTTNLPSARASAQSFIANGYLYEVGGGASVNGNSDSDDVIFTSINSNGTLASTCPGGYTCSTGSWVDANATVNGGSGSSYYAAGTASNFEASFSNGYLYISGGDNGNTGTNNTFNTVKYAKLNTNGSMGTWSTLTSFTTQRSSHGQVIANGFIYIIGGCSNLNVLNPCNSQAEVLGNYQYAQINNGGGGADGTWQAGTNLTNSLYWSASVASGGYLYTVGGCSAWNDVQGRCTTTSATSYASINADGSLSSWTAGTNLPVSIMGTGAVVVGGYLYVAGGCTSYTGGTCGATQTSVYSALLCTTINNGIDGCTGTPGTLGSWHALNSFATARFGAGVAVANGYMYIAGGAPGGFSSNLNDVQSAQIQPNGQLGTWGSVGSGATFTNARFRLQLVAYGNCLYIVGGRGSNLYSDVQYATVAANGQLGAWTATAGMQNTDSMLAAASNGYMYAYGSWTSSGNGTNQLQYAPIFANGQLGSWKTTAGYTGTNVADGSTGVIVNGYIYKLGGIKFDNSATFNDSEYAPLMGTPQVAHYSMQLATDKPTTPASFFTTLSAESPNSNITVGWATAKDAVTPTFGAVSSTSRVASGAKYPVSISGDGASYYWLPITIDDSQSFTFGETGGSSISYLQLNYHPNPSMRLRGGKTFNGGVQQSLDAL